MLILSAKKGNSIIVKIKEKIVKINILENENGNIKIGFDAPKEIKIYRQEIYDEIQNQNKKASNPNMQLIKFFNSNFYGENNIED